MKKLLLLVASITVALLIGELVVRSLDLSPSITRVGVGHYQLSENPLIRFEYKKSAKPAKNVPEGWLGHAVRGSLWDTFYTNSFGFRDVDHPLVKPENTIRIAVMGDSITSAQNVEREHRYSELLEKMLNRGQGKKRYEVLNFGVAGYDILQEVATLKEKVLQFAPDLAIFGYCLNDHDPSADSSIYRILLDRLTPDHRNSLHSLYTHTRRPFLALLHRSHLYRYLKYAAFRTTSMGDEASSELYEPASNILPTAFSMLSELRRDHAFEVLIVIFPSFLKLSNGYPFHHIHDHVKGYARHYNIPVLDLYGAYARETVEDGSEFRDTKDDYCHPNERGHQIAAKAIYHLLKSRY